MMAYYPDWVGDTFPPERIDFARFHWIDFAFALPTEHGTLTWDDPAAAPDLLARLVRAAHAKGTKVKLSVGGWTGSKYFSPVVADPATRARLVASILALYTQYGLDGIDIDWEYPGLEGAPGNRVAPDDTAHFLAFLRLLRAALPRGAALTAAALPVPFAGADGAPLQDVSAFALVLDWVLLMNYDVWGSSPHPGPNAPFYDACHNSTQPDANAVAAFRAWTRAGIPASQLVLGLPSYGYISRSDAATLHTRAGGEGDGDHGNGDNGGGGNGNDANDDDDGPPLRVKNDDGDGATDSGQVQFRSLVDQGALVRLPAPAAAPGAGTGTRPPAAFAGAHGFVLHRDACSTTAFLRSARGGQVVTLDDPRALAAKAAFVRATGMRGASLFDVHGDTDAWVLVDAVRGELGLGLGRGGDA